MLGLGADMELLASVRTVPVAHQTELLQHVQGAVDGGRDGRRIDRTAALDQLGPGQVAVGRGQDVDHRSPLRRPSKAAIPQPLADAEPGLGE